MQHDENGVYSLTHKPSIITLLHDVNNIPLLQFQLIFISWRVVIQGLKSAEESVFSTLGYIM